MQIGQIFLNFNLEKTLVALAIFENNYCTKFFVLKDLTELLFEKYRSNLMVPESLTGDTGLLGVSINFYNFLAGKAYGGDRKLDIIYLPIIEYSPIEIKQLLDENQRLQSIN